MKRITKPLLLALVLMAVFFTGCNGPYEANNRPADSETKNYGETEGEPNAQAIDAEGGTGSGRENQSQGAGQQGDSAAGNAKDVKTSTGVNNPATVKDSKDNKTPK